MNNIDMLRAARAHKYAVPAFNFYNIETLAAIFAAARNSRSPVILQMSESAIKYMGAEMVAMLAQSHKLHLDHGRSFDACKNAIDMGFDSVMFDGSDLPFDDNVRITKQVADYAHERGVSVEAELGALAGFEDGAAASDSHFTDPDQAALLLGHTGADSLAISIGTSHGIHKFPSPGGVDGAAGRGGFELRFDILEKIAALNPNTPIVLHGASSVPQKYIDTINANGGDVKHASGIPAAQLRRAVSLGISKINVDSDGRLAFLAATREFLAKNPASINPREFLSAAQGEMTKLYTDEIENIMGSANKMTND